MQILGHFSSGFAQLFIDVDQAIISTSIPSIAQLIQRLIWESWATKSGSSPSIISRPRWFRFAILFHAADPFHAEDYWGSSPPDRIPFCFSLSDLLQWRRVYVGIVQTRTERELIPSSAQIGCIWFIWLHWFIFQGFPASSQGSNNHHSTSPVEANWGPALLDSPRRFPALPPPVPSGPQRGSILPGGPRRFPGVASGPRRGSILPGHSRGFSAVADDSDGKLSPEFRNPKQRGDAMEIGRILACPRGVDCNQTARYSFVLYNHFSSWVCCCIFWEKFKFFGPPIRDYFLIEFVGGLMGFLGFFPPVHFLGVDPWNQRPINCNPTKQIKPPIFSLEAIDGEPKLK